MSSTTVSKFGQTFIAYGSYHNNIINKWIHIICVPLITATLIIGLTYVPLKVTFLDDYSCGAAEVFLGLALLYYVSINIWFAICISFLTIGLMYGWAQAFEGVNKQSLLIWSIIIHVVAWIFQFIGHGVFQKRKPALLDNVTQILNAPLFVIVELLSMVGLRSKEMLEWQKQVQKNVQAFKNKSHSA